MVCFLHALPCGSSLGLESTKVNAVRRSFRGRDVASQTVDPLRNWRQCHGQGRTSRVLLDVGRGRRYYFTTLAPCADIRDPSLREVAEMCDHGVMEQRVVHAQEKRYLAGAGRA